MDFLKGLSGQDKAPHAESAPPVERKEEASGGFMGRINEVIGGHDKAPHGANASTAGHKEETGGSGGFLGKINEAMGGGHKSEQNEDGLDKAVDWVQEHVLHKGPQTNESAIEQAKDEQISDAIRGQYKGLTGKDFFVKDKEH